MVDETEALVVSGNKQDKVGASGGADDDGDDDDYSD